MFHADIKSSYKNCKKVFSAQRDFLVLRLMNTLTYLLTYLLTDQFPVDNYLW